jgi:hypothetical protein
MMTAALMMIIHPLIAPHTGSHGHIKLNTANGKKNGYE